jgi:hypothetical protein
MIVRISRDPNEQAVMVVTDTCAQRSRWSPWRSWALRLAVVSSTAIGAWMVGDTASAMSLPDLDVGSRIEQIKSTNDDRPQGSPENSTQTHSEGEHGLLAPVIIHLVPEVLVAPSPRPGLSESETRPTPPHEQQSATGSVQKHFAEHENDAEPERPVHPDSPQLSAPPETAAPATDSKPVPEQVSAQRVPARTGTHHHVGPAPVRNSKDQPVPITPVHHTAQHSDQSPPPIPMPVPPLQTISSAASVSGLGNDARFLSAVLPMLPHAPGGSAVRTDTPHGPALRSGALKRPSTSPD